METVATINPATNIEYPTLSDRVQSTFIDTILIVILMFIFASVLDKYETAPDWVRIALFFGIWGIYEPVCTTLGFTIGNYAKGIRVRKISDTSKRINIIQAFNQEIADDRKQSSSIGGSYDEVIRMTKKYFYELDKLKKKSVKNN